MEEWYFNHTVNIKFTFGLVLLVVHKGFKSRSDLASMIPRGKLSKLLVSMRES